MACMSSNAPNRHTRDPPTTTLRRRRHRINTASEHNNKEVLSAAAVDGAHQSVADVLVARDFHAQPKL